LKCRCGWNLNNIARWPSSVLRHLQVQLPGVNLPWLYVGMLFATFSWHNEDNYLYSINYNHVGAAKQWYGVPGASADAFERVARRLFQQRLQEVPELLHHMTTQFSPGKIREMDVPVFRLRQGAGEFVVTFPRAFHSGFSYGFNAGEAVNFATAAWIDHAKLANERYRRLGRLAVLSHGAPSAPGMAKPLVP
jgi:histone demethylase JARID1